MKFFASPGLGSFLLSGLLAGSLLLACPSTALAGAYETGLKVYEQGQYELASRYFRQAITEQPGNPNVHYYLADSLVKTNHIAEAQLEYQKILAMAPNSQAARLSGITLSRINSLVDPARRQSGWNMLGERSGGIRGDLLQGLRIGKDHYLDEVTEAGRMIRWSVQELPIKLYIERTPKDTNNFQPAFVSVVRKGMDLWMKVLENRMRYVLVDTPEEADIRVVWLNTIDTRGRTGNDGSRSFTAGTTTPNIENDELQFMTVKLATLDIEGKPQPVSVMHSVAVHELGHAMGLLGHSTGDGDIMNSTNQQTVEPSERDINTIRMLYSQLPTVTNRPPRKEVNDMVALKEEGLKMDAYIKKTEALAAAENRGLTWKNLGVLYYKKAIWVRDNPKLAAPGNEGQFGYWIQKAMQVTETAIKLEPMDPVAYQKMSLLYQEAGDMQNALASVEQALKLDSKDPDSHLMKAWCLAKLQYRAQARASLDTYLLYQPSRAGSEDVQRILRMIGKS